MKDTDALFQLIHSLTTKEKVEFKKFARRHIIGEENNYTLLFDVMNREKTYDEQQIKTAIGDKRFLRQLHVTKNYLYHILLKAILPLNIHSTAGSNILFMLGEAGFMYNKKLFPQAAHTLAKAKVIAYRYEEFELLLEIIRREEQLILCGFEKKDAAKNINHLVKEKELLFDKLTNISHFRNLFFEIFFPLRNEGVLRDHIRYEHYLRLMNTPLLASKTRARSMEASFLYHMIHVAFLYCAEADMSKAYKTSLSYIRLLEKNPGLIRNRTSMYNITLYMHIGCCIALSKIKEAKTEIEKFRERHASLPKARAEVFVLHTVLLLHLYLTTKKFKKGIAIIPGISEQLVLYKDSIPDPSKAIIYLNIALVCWRGGYLEEALQWLHRIFYKPSLKVRSGVACIAKLMFLFVHFDMGNTGVLDTLSRSTQRFLSKRKNLFAAERRILKFFRDVTAANTRPLLIGVLRHFHSDLLKLKQDPYERRFFSDIDAIGWVEEKLSQHLQK